MRKLRESITATHRVDYFAQRSYIFITHASILSQSWESYHPTLLYLLTKIHKATPISSAEYHELLGFHILDLACRQADLANAYAVRARAKYKDRNVDAVLRALVTDDWVRFWRTRRVVDGYQRRIMGYAEERMRMHVLKCLGRSYMSVSKEFVETVTAREWEELVNTNKVGWELNKETGVVVIRRPKLR
jgi:hypothetical protein